MPLLSISIHLQHSFFSLGLSFIPIEIKKKKNYSMMMRKGVGQKICLLFKWYAPPNSKYINVTGSLSRRVISSVVRFITMSKNSISHFWHLFRQTGCKTIKEYHCIRSVNTSAIYCPKKKKEFNQHDVFSEWRCICVKMMPHQSQYISYFSK